jgi:outer membrane protein assembly factor BamB
MLKKILPILTLILTACQNNKDNFSPEKGNYFIKNLTALELKVEDTNKFFDTNQITFKKFASNSSIKGLIKDTLFLGSPEGIITGYNTDLKAIWSFNFSDKTQFESCKNYTISSSEGKIVIVCDSNDLATFDRQGKVLWKTKVSSPLASEALIINNQVLVADNNEDLYSYDFITGKILWLVPGFNNKALAKTGWQKILSHSNLILQKLSGDTIRALDKNTGNLEWFFSSDDLEFVQGKSQLGSNNLLVKGDIFYFTSKKGELVAIKLASEKPLWVKDYSILSGYITLFEDKIIVINDFGQLLVLSSQDGQILWSHDIIKLFDGKKNDHLITAKIMEPIIYNNQLILTNSDGLLVNLSLIDGKILTKTKSKPFNKIIKFHDRIIVESNNNLFLLILNGI